MRKGFRRGAPIFMRCRRLVAASLLMLVAPLTPIRADDPPAASSSGIVAADEADNGPRVTGDLRVMTFNIRYGTANDGDNHWKHRRDLVIEVLRQRRPDVVGLQEALRFQMDAIRAALPEYGEVGVGRDDGKARGEYSAILYLKERLRPEQQGTFWLSDTPETPGSKSWGNDIPRICTWARFADRQGQPFYHYNTHLDHISQPSREKSAELIARHIAHREHPEDPVLLTGDFNAGEDNPAIRLLRERADLSAHDRSVDSASVASASQPARSHCLDTFRTLHPDAKQTGSFGAWKGRTDGPKIDYVFAPPEAKVLHAVICHDREGERYPSDHFPVVARVRMVQ